MYTPNIYADVIEYFHRHVAHRDTHRAVAAPAQRPGLRRGRRRAGCDGRRRPCRGHAVRQRRAHGQRRRRHAGDEPVQPGRRPAARHQRHRRASAASPSTATGCRSTPAIRTSATWCTPPSRAPTRTPSRRACDAPRPTLEPDDESWEVPYLPIDPKHVGRTLRGRDPGQQPVRQGRRGVHHEGRARLRPAPTAPDRVLQDDPDDHRGHRHGDQPDRRCGTRSSRPSTCPRTPRIDVAVARAVDERRRRGHPHHGPAAGRRRAPHGDRRGQRPDRRLRARPCRSTWALHSTWSTTPSTPSAPAPTRRRSPTWRRIDADGVVRWGVGTDPNILTASLRAVVCAHRRAG